MDENPAPSPANSDQTIKDNKTPTRANPPASSRFLKAMVNRNREMIATRNNSRAYGVNEKNIL
jgi:hypothetical protein